MILSLTESYLGSLFSQFNARLDSTVKIHKATDDNDFSELPGSQAQINYMCFIKDVSIEENEVQNIYNVSNRIDFIFIVNHKDNTVYKLNFDRYLTEFFRMIKTNRYYNDSGITTALSIIDIRNIKIIDGDKFEDEYYRPAIEFESRIYDREQSNIILKAESL